MTIKKNKVAFIIILVLIIYFLAYDSGKKEAFVEDFIPFGGTSNIDCQFDDSYLATCESSTCTHKKQCTLSKWQGEITAYQVGEEYDVNRYPSSITGQENLILLNSSRGTELSLVTSSSIENVQFKFHIEVVSGFIYLYFNNVLITRLTPTADGDVELIPLPNDAVEIFLNGRSLRKLTVPPENRILLMKSITSYEGIALINTPQIKKTFKYPIDCVLGSDEIVVRNIFNNEANIDLLSKTPTKFCENYPTLLVSESNEIIREDIRSDIMQLLLLEQPITISPSQALHVNYVTKKWTEIIDCASDETYDLSTESCDKMIGVSFTTLQSKNEEIIELTNQLADKEDRLANLQQIVDSLETDYSSSKDEILLLEGQLTDSEDKNEFLELTITELQLDIVEIQDLLNERDSTIAEDVALINDLTLTNDELVDIVADYKNKWESEVALANSLDLTLQQKEDLIADYEQRLADEQATTSQLNLDVDDLNTKIEDYRSNIITKDTLIEELDITNTELLEINEEYDERLLAKVQYINNLVLTGAEREFIISDLQLEVEEQVEVILELEEEILLLEDEVIDDEFIEEEPFVEEPFMDNTIMTIAVLAALTIITVAFIFKKKR